MKAIWKYRLAGSTTYVPIREGWKVVHVDLQQGEIFLWVEVKLGNPFVSKIIDPLAGVFERTFHIVATGEDIPETWDHVGTVQDSPFVWHIYEEERGSCPN